MALALRKWQGVLLLSFFMIVQRSSQQNPKVPCLFFYGDSIFDNGNNNNLTTLAKSNYPPYGIDLFPPIPTGRFTNGRNLADFIAQQLGFPFSVPPFARVSSNLTLKGANYASGGSGILNETGRELGARISFPMQIQNHRTTVSRIARILGNKNSPAYLRQCLYVVESGTNDYLNNYFLPILYNTSRQYIPQRFADILVQQYTQQLKILYELRARKIVVFGLAQLGCTPLARRRFPRLLSPCVETINNAVQIFNNKLKQAIDTLNRNFRDAKFIYINANAIQSRIATLPGFRLKNKPCCRTNPITTFCLPLSPPCLNRNEYVFWDEVNPTGALYSRIAAGAYRALLPTDAHPFDISHLVGEG